MVIKYPYERRSLVIHPSSISHLMTTTSLASRVHQYFISLAKDVECLPRAKRRILDLVRRKLGRKCVPRRRICIELNFRFTAAASTAAIGPRGTSRGPSGSRRPSSVRAKSNETMYRVNRVITRLPRSFLIE